MAEKASSKLIRRCLVPRMESLASGAGSLGAGYSKGCISLAELVEDGGAGIVWTREAWPPSMHVSSGEVRVW